ncbi:MAG: hypothetical protein EBQ80_02435 [Proteobacteria bacterium]|nr:hypothetical protein [Pseudomonadota bacterium]
MWTDYYLKYANEAEMMAALPAEWVLFNGGYYENHVSLQVLGVLHRDDTGEALSGFHANLRLAEGVALPAALGPFVIVPPAQPKVVFAA